MEKNKLRLSKSIYTRFLMKQTEYIKWGFIESANEV